MKNTNQIMLILFFIVFTVSCNNENKSGSDIVVDTSRGIEQFAATYDNTDGRYVTINSDGSIIIGVNSTPDTIPANEVRYAGWNKFEFLDEQYSGLYSIEFGDGGNTIILIYGSQDNPITFTKQ